MKKLICVADIQQLVNEQKKECLTTSETIITPAARDLADEFDICFLKQDVSQPAHEEISLIMARLCSDHGLLQQLIGVLKEPSPFESQQDSSGFQLIHGNTIQFDQSESEPGMAKQILFANFNQLKVEIVSLSKGLVKDCVSEEAIYFVLEGQLETRINQKQFDSQKGDIQYFPSRLERRVTVKEAVKLLVITKVYEEK